MSRYVVRRSSLTFVGLGVTNGVKVVELCLFLRVNVRWGMALLSLDLLWITSQSG
jgi:hypothetical protein